MCAQITIFGTCHDVQGAEKWPGRKLDDAVYKRLLSTRFNEKDFLFEEAAGLGPTTAERLAEKRLGAGHYLDVDPSAASRKEHGIAEKTSDTWPIEPCNEYTDFESQQFVDEHAKREESWVRRIQETRFENGLFVCGEIHTLSMSFRLRSAGYSVEAFHYMPYQEMCRRPHVQAT